ncbi:MAG: FAD-binding oxidoreductase [Mycolicibacterium sp.]|uniref:FAD-binding oxidoreductase n=1 Tax=Mycolicibacterium sp. TaxID=2320850 RepID=UPI003D132F19
MPTSRDQAGLGAPGITRRKLFESIGSAALAAALAPGLAACGSSQSVRTVADQLVALRGRLRGALVLPGEDGFDTSTQPWNARFTDVRPLAAAIVADADDVSAAIEFARENDVPFAVRNGAHSFGGYSGTTGLLINVSGLNSVSYDPATGLAELGAGMTNLPTYQALWQHKVTVAAGTCPSVGVSGLTMAAGIGRLSPRDGLTCDRLESLELVTAAGKVIRVSEAENPDLFWACRGGGGGNFGVATRLRFRATPVDMPFTEMVKVYPLKHAVEVARSWQRWIETLPDTINSDLALVTGDPDQGGGGCEVWIHSSGSPAGADGQFKQLAADIGVRPLTEEAVTLPYYQFQRPYECAALNPAECTYQSLSPTGRLDAPAMYAKSNFADQVWPDEAVESLRAAIAARQADPTMTPRPFNPSVHLGRIMFERLGGAVNSVSPEATAFPHRRSRFLIQLQGRWAPDAPPSAAELNMRWVSDTFENVGAWLTGSAYCGYVDPLLVDWPQQYYGQNLPRLQRIKAAVDPDNVFRFAQSIQPA